MGTNWKIKINTGSKRQQLKPNNGFYKHLDLGTRDFPYCAMIIWPIHGATNQIID